MKFIIVFACFFLSHLSLFSQVVNTGVTSNYDSVEVGKVTIGGQVDTYYGYDFNEPVGSLRPYCVSSARHNEITINLAFIDLKYKNKQIRAHLVPGFGTYINDNYVSEKGSLKNLVEANAGVKISKKKEIWIDAGILGSPYTNETAISKDHLMYTRSFAPEYVPYYLAGVKISIPVNSKINFYGYVLNGWQQIQDNNNPLAVGTQVEYRPNNNILFNWDTYVGSEISTLTPNYRTRYFSDIYVIYKPKGKFSFTSCVYAGVQETKDLFGDSKNLFWGQANFIGNYEFTKTSSLSARVEYFSDPNAALVPSIVNPTGFESFSTGLCYNLKITNNALFRLENRFYYSLKDQYINRENNTTQTGHTLIANLTVWF